MEEENEVWITTQEAARILEVGKWQINYLAAQGRLDCRKGKPGTSSLFRREDILALAADPVRLHHNERRRRMQERSRNRPANLPQESEAWITTRQAAEILGVQRVTVLGLIRNRRLSSLQTHPGQSGSPHRLLKSQVEAYRDYPLRVKQRRIYDQGGLRLGKSKQERDECATYCPIAPWLTTRQVMQWLGVTQWRVYALRKQGRIYGYYRCRPGIGRNSRWLYSRRDVEKLLADPRYHTYRAYWDKMQAARIDRAVEATWKASAGTHMRSLMVEGGPGDIW